MDFSKEYIEIHKVLNVLVLLITLTFGNLYVNNLMLVFLM